MKTFNYLITNFINIIKQLNIKQLNIKQLNIEQLIEILCAVISGIGLMVILSKLKEKNEYQKM